MLEALAFIIAMPVILWFAMRLGIKARNEYWAAINDLPGRPQWMREWRSAQ